VRVGSHYKRHRALAHIVGITLASILGRTLFLALPSLPPAPFSNRILRSDHKIGLRTHFVLFSSSTLLDNVWHLVASERRRLLRTENSPRQPRVAADAFGTVRRDSTLGTSTGH